MEFVGSIKQIMMMYLLNGIFGLVNFLLKYKPDIETTSRKLRWNDV